MLLTDASLDCVVCGGRNEVTQSQDFESHTLTDASLDALTICSSHTPVNYSA